MRLDAARAARRRARSGPRAAEGSGRGPAGPRAAHDGNARAAASTARATSSGPAADTAPRRAPSIGLNTSIVSGEATRLPSMKWSAGTTCEAQVRIAMTIGETLAARGESGDGIRPPLHPASHSCTSLAYCQLFSVVTPCDPGASAPSVLRHHFHHGLLARPLPAPATTRRRGAPWARDSTAACTTKPAPTSGNTTNRSQIGGVHRGCGARPSRSTDACTTRKPVSAPKLISDTTCSSVSPKRERPGHGQRADGARSARGG